MKSDTAKVLSVLAIIFAGFFSVVIRGGDAIRDIFKTAHVKDFLSGSLSGEIDRAVFKAIPRSTELDGFASGVLYRGLGDAGPQVWAGCKDWLYSAEEVRTNTHDAENLDARARLIPRLVQAVAKLGILLVVVPVPDKAEQVEDQLCGITAERSRLRARRWTQAVNASSLHQINLRDRWPRPGYWRTDTHWDNVGARFAAEAIAKIVNEKLGAASERIVLNSGALHERPGDLARLAGLTEAPRWLAPAAEYEADARVQIERSGGLLDDAPTPSILLAGSSFSRNSGFVDYLQASVGREVAQLSEAGGGFAGALINLLQRKRDDLASAKVVIWEFPMRSLTAPLSEAERQLLKQQPSSP